MAANIVFGELKKLVSHEEVVCTGRGSVEEIPTDLRVKFHHNLHAKQAFFLPWHSAVSLDALDEAQEQLSNRGLTNYVVGGAIPMKLGAIWRQICG